MQLMKAFPTAAATMQENERGWFMCPTTPSSVFSRYFSIHSCCLAFVPTRRR